jgi:cbb3-type cytochrome oxidase subunit 3
MKEELEGLNLVELFELLEPVPEPAPISMMPQTAGWLWLGLLCLVLLVGVAWILRRRWRENAYRRQALLELKNATEPSDLAALLRRTALATYPRKDVASLYGPDWLTFLDSSYRGSAFSSDAGRALVEAPYVRRAEVEDLKPLVHTWIKSHRNGAR